MIDKEKVIKVIQDKITFLEKYEDLESFKSRILILKDVLIEINKL
jgi:hypothetical protein